MLKQEFKMKTLLDGAVIGLLVGLSLGILVGAFATLVWFR